MKLRDYQTKCVQAVIDCWKEHPSCVVVLPTGCGKTVVFAEIVRRRLESFTDPGEESNAHAMILAHREELVMQAKEKIESVTGKTAVIEMGEFKAGDFFGRRHPVVVSSVQTQITERMNRFNPDDYQTLVIDEAHHATAKSYRRCIDHYMQNGDCRLLGVTATPDRADEKALGQVFDAVAFEYSVLDAVRDGWLVPVRQKLVKVGTLDFSGISTTAGDFNQGELSQIVEEEQNLHSVAVPTVQICGRRRAIVFAVTVKQAERLCEILNRMRGGCAEWLCGKTPKEERHQILERFRAGGTQFVVNVGVLTEGFDDAGVEVVVMARPTKSRALYAQMAGRATRPAAEIAGRLGACEAGEKRCALIAASSKPSCLIIDFVGNAGRHKLVTTADILGGKEDDPDEEQAREMARRRCEASEEGLDMAEEIDRAREEIVRTRAEVEARKLADAKARSFITATARFVAISVDPFDVLDLTPVDRRTVNPFSNKRLSYKQRQLIREKIGVNPDTLTNAEGQVLVTEYFRRMKARLATIRQSKFLRKHGFPMPMTIDDASATISWILGK